MSKTDPRTLIVGLMRANVDRIGRDLTGYLTRECDDLLAAGIDRGELGFSLMSLALFHNTQIVGTAAMVAQLREFADVMERKLSERRSAFDERVQH